MVVAETSIISVVFALTLTGATYAPATPAPGPGEPPPQPNSGQGFASTQPAATGETEGCWFSAHKPFRLHTGDKHIHGESKITGCTTPAPVWCRLQSRLQMWVPYSGQWVQKGQWGDHGWKACRPGITLTPSYKCPRHSTKNKFITDGWLAVVGHQGGTASNYVTSPPEELTCD